MFTYHLLPSQPLLDLLQPFHSPKPTTRWHYHANHSHLESEWRQPITSRGKPLTSLSTIISWHFPMPLNKSGKLQVTRVHVTCRVITSLLQDPKIISQKAYLHVIGLCFSVNKIMRKVWSDLLPERVGTPRGSQDTKFLKKCLQGTLPSLLSGTSAGQVPSETNWWGSIRTVWDIWWNIY